VALVVVEMQAQLTAMVQTALQTLAAAAAVGENHAEAALAAQES